MTDSLIDGMNELETSFTAWAEAKNDIRAAMVVGSRARADHPADEWSDLDVAFMTTSPAKYRDNARWISEIAPVSAIDKDQTGATYHVLFEGHRDAGIAVIPAKSVRLATMIVPGLRRLPGVASLGPMKKLQAELESTTEYYRRGARILFDKDGTAVRFLAAFPPRHDRYRSPSAAAFSATVNEFWIGAVWTAKHLMRGETWYARSVGCEGTLRETTLRMMEWNAHARTHEDIDTWSSGRFIEEWGEPSLLSELKAGFSGYDSTSLSLGLGSMMTLFDKLSSETAEYLGYSYSAELPHQLASWVRSLGSK